MHPFFQSIIDLVVKLMPKNISIKILPNLKSLVSFNKIQITNSDIGNNVNYNDEIKSIGFNWAKLDTPTKSELERLLPQALEEDFIFIENEAEDFVVDFNSKEKLQDTQDALHFLMPLIPIEDVNIWRASLYLKRQFEIPTHDKEQIKDLKRRIIEKYGDKGKNISNLCSAGYLEIVLKPLYEYLKKDSENEASAKNIFLSKYKVIVQELPFTIFVYSDMTEKSIHDEIERRRQSGTKFIIIHGIGKDNVRFIRKTIDQLESKISIKKSIKEENSIIFVKIIF